MHSIQNCWYKVNWTNWIKSNELSEVRYFAQTSKMLLVWSQFAFINQTKGIDFYKQWPVFSVDGLSKIERPTHCASHYKRMEEYLKKGKKGILWTQFSSCNSTYCMDAKHVIWSRKCLKNKSIQIGKLFARHRPSICPLFTREQTGPLTSFGKQPNTFQNSQLHFKTTKYISKQPNTFRNNLIYFFQQYEFKT